MQNFQENEAMLEKLLQINNSISVNFIEKVQWSLSLSGIMSQFDQLA